MSGVVLVSAIALMDKAGRLLLAERPPGKKMAGLWEFPGGKVEPGETPEQALVRECHEELAVTIAVSDLEALTFASHGYDDFHLLMPVYLCRTWQGEPTPQEGQEIAWVHPDEMLSWPMPPADAPLVATLRRVLAAT